jgi:hypothetical protein
LPTERIKITPDEFRATNSSNEITFSSNNRYLKTDIGGEFKTGGYDRVPFLAGYEVTVDQPDAGGFAVFNTFSGMDMTFDIPFQNVGAKLCATSHTGSSAGPFPYSHDESSPSATMPLGAAWVIPGTYYFLTYDSTYTVSQSFRMAVSPAYYSGDSMKMWPIDIIFSTPGKYTIPYNTIGNQWYRYSDNSPYTPPANVQPGWKPVVVYITQPPVNLSLAVTQ